MSEKVIDEVMNTTTNKIIDKYSADKSALIQILLDIQQNNNWLPQDLLYIVSYRLNVPLPKIYHIVTFYKAFSLKPCGKYKVSVCLGTACHVRGAVRLVDNVSEYLNIKPGQTTKDGRFTLGTVNCMGCCALGPVLSINNKYYSNPDIKELKQILSECK